MHKHIHMHVYAHLYTDRKSQQRRLNASNNIIDAHTHPYTYACIYTRDDVKLAQLVRARDCLSRGRRFDSGKNSKNKKLRTQIYMDVRYKDPQARVLNYCFK